ncbi:MAG: agmatine deiminase family protein [Actinomycetes bacterium]
MTSTHDPDRTESVRQLSRRSFLAVAAGSVAGCSLGNDPLAGMPTSTMAATAEGELRRTWRVPAEDVRHRRTWMAWPSSWAIWGNWLPGIQQDIALIARTVARYEPVVMLASDAGAARKARRLCGRNVRVIGSITVDDCWLRDSGPIFRTWRTGSLGALGLGFNGWGAKQIHANDAEVARQVARRADARFERADIVGEGGGVECDGDGTLMATESCWINDNRNPGKTKAQIERELLAEYGAKKMIWVPGLRGEDITDNHIDATSRFVKPGVVMVQVPPPSRDDIWAHDAREQLRILSRSKDARGRRLTVIEMAGPGEVRSSSRSFLDSYVNFALVNGAVITAQFGDQDRDRSCRKTLRDAFPGREVVQLDVDRLHRGGGGIHCVTQQEPA